MPRLASHLLASAAFSLALVQAGPTLAQEGEDFVWETFSYDPTEPDDLGLTIAYGVAETDLIAISGACITGPDGMPAARVEFSADPGALANGAATLARISSANDSVAVSGMVTGVDAELGVQGVSATVRLAHPVWPLLESGAGFSSRMLGGGPAIDLPGGDTGAVSAFLEACTLAVLGPDAVAAMQQQEESVAAVSPAPALPNPSIPEPTLPTPTLPPAAETAPAAPLPEAPPAPPPSADAAQRPDAGATFLSCAAIPGLASQDTGQARSLTIENRSPAPRSIVWIGLDGGQMEFGALQPGQSGTLTSDAGHVWLFSDGAGACVEVVRVGEAEAIYLRQIAAVSGTGQAAPAPQAPANSK